MTISYTLIKKTDPVIMKKNLFILFLSLLFIQTNAQNSVKSSIGFGVHDGLNAGFDYQHMQSEFSFSIGLWPYDSDLLLSSLNYYYHFAGKSKYTIVKPWFIRSGVFLMRTQSVYYIKYSILPTLRLGREFNLSDNWGISVDAGAVYFAYSYTKVLAYNPYPTGLLIPFMPNGSIRIYYRF